MDPRIRAERTRSQCKVTLWEPSSSATNRYLLIEETKKARDSSKWANQMRAPSLNTIFKDEFAKTPMPRKHAPVVETPRISEQSKFLLNLVTKIARTKKPEVHYQLDPDPYNQRKSIVICDRSKKF